MTFDPRELRTMVMDDNEISDRDVGRELERRELATAATQIRRLANFITGVFASIGFVGLLVGGLIAVSKDDGQFVAERMQFGITIAAVSVIQIGLVVVITSTAGLIARHIHYHAPADDRFDE